MMKLTPTLYVRQFTTVTYPLLIKINGAPLDITGWSIVMAAKKRLANTDVESVFKVVQTVHTDAINGESSISLTAEDTSIAGEYYYDIALFPASGDPTGIFHGKFVIIPAVVTEL